MLHDRANDIRSFLAQAIYEGRKDIVRLGVSQFDATRQLIHRQLKAMVDEGILTASGNTRGRVYALRTLAEHSVTLPIEQRPAEDAVWREGFSALVSKLPESVRHICTYGFTEMFNNAVDHSEGKSVTAHLTLTAAAVKMSIRDDGVGIFRKIKDSLHLADEREAILELAKGKVTTDPDRHSGEGVFFTSRMFDSFSMAASTLLFTHKSLKDDWLIETASAQPGTVVEMELAVNSTRTTKQVFDSYTSEADVPAFDKTHAPVSLLLVGEESLVSRSQAKRLLTRFNRFKEVLLDFHGVKQIGQAFADEIFRVFQNQNPDIQIEYLRANDEVENMIKRVLNSQ